MEEYESWLVKAKEDLDWTKHNIKARVYYGACFTAQQAVEKGLKSYIIYRKQPLRKIHDVIALLEDCMRLDKNFASLRSLIKVVAPYYIVTRYPLYEDFVTFDEIKARQAYDSARQVLKYIEEQLALAD